MTKPQMLFILGRGRSGTSLLQTILNAHSQISVAPEAQFIMFLRKKYQNAHWNESTIASFSKDIWFEERLVNWHFSKDKLKEDLLTIKEPNYAACCQQVYVSYTKSKNKDQVKVLGDKNPYYALYVNI